MLSLVDYLQLSVLEVFLVDYLQLLVLEILLVVNKIFKWLILNIEYWILIYWYIDILIY